MNSRERVMAAVSGDPADRLPAFCFAIDDLDYWLSGFKADSRDELFNIWGLDISRTYCDDYYTAQPGKTIWGCEDNWDAGYSGAKIPPLGNAETIKDIEKHPWPTIEQVDFNEITRQIEGLDDTKGKIAYFGFLHTAVFCSLCDLFGMDTAMINMHLEPHLIEGCVEKIEHFLLSVFDKTLRKHAKDVDFLWWGDDFSTQRGMMISPDMWRKFLKPTYMRVFDLIKTYNVKIWFHSCGTFAPVLGELVEGGMDVWETVQAHLVDNEPEQLKKNYGKSLTFFGAINCQKTLPFGSTEDVRKEVRERFRVLGRGGGYIAGPDHSLQKNIPWKNIEALYDEVKKCTY